MEKKEKYIIEIILGFLILAIFYNILKNDIFNGYFVSFIFPIVLTAFFAGIIIYATNDGISKQIKHSTEENNKQRNYEIRQREYDLILEKLEIVSKWLGLIWDLYFVSVEKGKITEQDFKNFEENNKDLLNNINAIFLIYIPELDLFNKIFSTYFKAFKQCPESRDILLKISNLHGILTGVIYIKKRILDKGLYGIYKFKIDKNQEYYSEVEKYLNNQKKEQLEKFKKYNPTYKDIDNIVKNWEKLMFEEKEIELDGEKLEELKNGIYKFYGFKRVYWFPYFKEILTKDDKDTKFFK